MLFFLFLSSNLIHVVIFLSSSSLWVIWGMVADADGDCVCCWLREKLPSRLRRRGCVVYSISASLCHPLSFFPLLFRPYFFLVIFLQFSSNRTAWHNTTYIPYSLNHIMLSIGLFITLFHHNHQLNNKNSNFHPPILNIIIINKTPHYIQDGKKTQKLNKIEENFYIHTFVRMVVWMAIWRCWEWYLDSRWWWWWCYSKTRTYSQLTLCTFVKIMNYFCCY